MNKQLVAAGVAGLFVAPLALAQSSVTVFGIADAAVRSVDNQGLGSMSSLVSGSASTSRIGFRGREDMGGGLSASFHLEHGTGAGHRSRQQPATSSGTAAPPSALPASAGANSAWAATSSRATARGPATTRSRTSASRVRATSIRARRWARSDRHSGRTTTRRCVPTTRVQYLLPKLGGLEGEMMVAAGEGGDATAGRAKLVGARLTFRDKRFSVSAASTQSENSLTGAGKFKDDVVGGSVTFGTIDITAAWRRMRFATVEQSNVLVGAEAAFGLHIVKASWQQVDMEGKRRRGRCRRQRRDASWVWATCTRCRSAPRCTHRWPGSTTTAAHAFRSPAGRRGWRQAPRSTGYEAGVLHRF